MISPLFGNVLLFGDNKRGNFFPTFTYLITIVKNIFLSFHYSKLGFLKIFEGYVII